MDDIIQVENLVAGYEKKIVLEDINFTIKKGEMVGIIGPNGSGKSTLLKTMRRLLSPISGNIKLFNENIYEYEEKEFARKIAYLQQNVNVSFGYTAKDVVMIGRYPYLNWWEDEKKKDEEIVRQCMEYTGVLNLEDTPVQNVSGGQKQRILLAKVLAQQTPVMFLDEPTTGLDLVYQEEILRFCQSLCNAGKTILAVLHELSLAAKYCSKFILIGNGKIVAQGPPENILTNKNLTNAYGSPINVIKNPLSGSFELSTFLSEKDSAKQNKLINIICNRNCNDD